MTLTATYARHIMGQESKDELQKILQLLEDVVRDGEAEIQRLQSLTEQEELYLDPEGTLSQALGAALARSTPSPSCENGLKNSN